MRSLIRASSNAAMAPRMWKNFRQIASAYFEGELGLHRSDSWGDPKHWILLDDPLEVDQWRAAGDRKEWAGAG